MAEELRGWKDIGAHFGASDRTAQRWEREHAMPVHRTGRTRGASVFALPEELDAWRTSPEGVRARTDNGKAANGQPAATAVLDVGQADNAGLARRSRKTVIALAVAAAILTVVVALAWVIYPRRPSAVAIPARSLSEAYSVPNSSTVFLLKITTSDGTPFVFHVLDGGMATLAIRGGPKLGFVPVRVAGTVKLAVTQLYRSPKGGEGLRQLTRLALTPHSRVHFDHPGMSVDVEWTDTLKSSDLPAAPPDSPRQCCVICENMTACAAQATAPCGTCCGFGGCVGAK